jgi:hypothetical protein
MVSVDEVPEEGTGGGEWLLLRLVNLSTYKRCKAALHAVEERKGVSQELIDVCFGRCEPRFDSRPFSDHVPLLLSSASSSQPPHRILQLPLCDAAALNPSQVEAVRLCLAAHNIALVHGPPGTGKRLPPPPPPSPFKSTHYQPWILQDASLHQHSSVLRTHFLSRQDFHRRCRNSSARGARLAAPSSPASRECSPCLILPQAFEFSCVPPPMLQWTTSQVHQYLLCNIFKFSTSLPMSQPSYALPSCPAFVWVIQPVSYPKCSSAGLPLHLPC